MAKEFDAQVFRITPADIENGTQINDIVKSLNLYNPLEGSRRKIILIDDIDEFYYAYRNRLIKELPRLSRNPIIFTSKSYDFPQEFKNYTLKVGKYKSWYIEIEPISSQIYSLLKKRNTKYTDDELREIANNSPSVRSAILSLNGPINDMIVSESSIFSTIRSISQRKLNEPIIRKNKKFIFNSLHGCFSCSISDFSSVVDRFLTFNERIVSKHETYDGVAEGINCWFVNNMKEPVEKIKWYYEFKKKKNNKKKPVEEIPEKKPVKKTQMDRWL